MLATHSSLYQRRNLKPESYETILRALQTDAVARRILAKGVTLEQDQLCGVRLNINEVTPATRYI